ncbi:dsDNA nuclease domain-containing protein [Ornithinimicrobium cryptoxanthini]|uniref:DUF4297 domain-containing protein n=1 Tax=Ornithinimicrobium cryptoxanthini TaxID=2934161 RepID=A0ABY4YM91_9MICO|nr:dsDNA nuclease domain-containing protein [Ornithinimicrobium cryptoxanthini]USQ77804.1 DUF4297 domain-containing protein [Ornithinimicrobium cryptoxanthini]
MSEECSAAVPASLANRRPGEDAGATSSGYYEFQYGWVARHALEMSDPRNDLEWVLCEWHTDFILGWATSFAPVSVKHREPNSSHWTIATLFSDGGMLTLYRRWYELGRPKQCRWVTNGGLNRECRTLAKACASTDTDALDNWLDKHVFRFVGASRSDVLAFLLALRMDNNSSQTTDQRILHIERFARPALRALGLSTREAPAVYDAVVGIARTASQGFVGTEPTTWSSSRADAFDSAVLAAADSTKRVIRPGPIGHLARKLAAPAAAEPPPEPAADTTLIKKLRRGDVVPTADMAARRARMGWTAFEAMYSEPLPLDGQPSKFESLRSRVVSEAADSQIVAERSGQPYGNRMYQEVRARMRAVAVEPSPLGALTPDLLMGLAYDLTARCEIWWSERFDVDAPALAQAVEDAQGES